MNSRRIGGLEVSVVGLGCNNFGRRIDEARSGEVVHAALDAGINFFDTADIYGDTRSEQILGRALGTRRSEVVLATKFGMAVDEKRKGAHPHYVLQAVEASLRRLGTDRIDLYQLHEPDPSVPIADTLGALDELVKAGKVREIGCSNFNVRELEEARGAVKPGAARFASVQNEYSLLNRQPEEGVLEACARLSMGFIPYFPLASGLLTGKYRPGEAAPPGTRLSGRTIDPVRLERVVRLEAVAARHGATLLELAFGWLLTRTAVVSVIAGATSAEQVRANVAAGGWKMPAEVTAEVAAIG